MTGSIILFLATCLLLSAGKAATVKKHFRLSWETGAPNGQSRDMILINGEYPGPDLVFDEDDDVEVIQFQMPPPLSFLARCAFTQFSFPPMGSHSKHRLPSKMTCREMRASTGTALPCEARRGRMVSSASVNNPSCLGIRTFTSSRHTRPVPIGITRMKKCPCMMAYTGPFSSGGCPRSKMLTCSLLGGM